jgi:hypothetical protein
MAPITIEFPTSDVEIKSLSFAAFGCGRADLTILALLIDERQPPLYAYLGTVRSQPPNWIINFVDVVPGDYQLHLVSADAGDPRRAEPVLGAILASSYHVHVRAPTYAVQILAPAGQNPVVCDTSCHASGTGDSGATVSGTMHPTAGPGGDVQGTPVQQPTQTNGSVWILTFAGLNSGTTYELQVTQRNPSDYKTKGSISANHNVCS